MIAGRRHVALLLFCAVALVHAPGGAVAQEGEALEPMETLQTAFDRMFNYTSARRVAMRTWRDGRHVHSRNFEMIYKKVDGQGRTFLRFTAPEYLRETALMIFENHDRSDDVWTYIPAFRKPRRINASQKGDAFYGTDLTYEDLEHHDWTRYDVKQLPDAQHGGRVCSVIEAIAPVSSQYARAVAFIEKGRTALLRVDFYKRGSMTMVKTLEVDPDEITELDGALLPARMLMRLAGRDASTEVRFEKILLEPKIPDQAFLLERLETRVKPFDLVRAMRSERAQ